METGQKTVANEEISRAVTELCIACAQSHIKGAMPIPLPLEDRAMYVPSH